MSPLPAELKRHVMKHGQVLKDAVDKLSGLPEHWHTTLLIDLGAENVANCLELVQGVDSNNISRCSWAARNLFELHYFVRFVVASPENAKRFHEDIACDYQDLIKRYAKYQQHAEVLQAAQTILDHYWEHHMEAASKTDTFLSTRDIAEKMGELETYSDANKFLSKFVHPTSLSIQARKSAQVRPLMMASIVGCAAPIIARTFPLLAEHMLEHSVRA